MASETINDLYLKYANKVGRSLESDRYFQYLFEMIQAGENVLEQKYQVMHKVVDEAWLSIIEDTLDDINIIIDKPRRFIATKEEVVPVALARKITADSVRHLSQNTQFIASTENGDIQPTRVLNVSTEESYDLYENRFIYHLIQRLVTFIDKRTDVIFWSTGDETQNALKFESKVDDAYEEITYKIEMVVKNRQSFAENDSDNMGLFMRIDRVRRMVMALKNSSFCDIMAGCSKVRSPIQRTNLIMKDPHYRACYKLWQFLEQYDSVGYSIDVQDSMLEFDEEYLYQMYTNMITNYAVFKSLLEPDKRDLLEVLHTKHRKIKPKFVKKIKEVIVDDYDLEDVEIRQVIIEEVTQAQLDAEAKLAEETELRKQAEQSLEDMDAQMITLQQQVMNLTMMNQQAELQAEDERVAKEEAQQELEKEKEERAADHEQAAQNLAKAQEETELARKETQEARAEAVQAKAQAQETRQRAEAEIAQTKESAETEIARTREKADAEIAQTREKADAEIAQTREKADAEIAQAKEAADTEIARIKAEADEQIAETRQNAAAEIAQTKESAAAEIAQAKEAADTEIARIKAEADEQIAEAKASAAAEIAQAKEATDTEIARIKAEADEQIAEAKASAAAEIARTKESAAAEIAVAKEAAENEIAEIKSASDKQAKEAAQEISDLQRERASLTQSLEKSRQEKDSLKKELTEKAEAGEARAVKLEEELRQLRAELDETKRNAKEESDRQEQQIILARQRAEEQVNKVRQEAREQQEKQQLEAREQLDQLRTAGKEQLEQQQREAKEQQEKLRQEAKEMQEKLQHETEEKLALEKQNAEAKLSQLQKETGEKLDQLTKESADLKRQLNEAFATREEREEQVAELERELKVTQEKARKAQEKADANSLSKYIINRLEKRKNREGGRTSDDQGNEEDK